MEDPMERLGSEPDSSIKVDSDLSMEIDPPPPLLENVATLGRVVPAVVVLRTNAESAGADKRRGIVLTNRHVVKPGPVVAEAMFVNREEVPVHPI